MSARLLLLWYHARLGLSWAALAPPLALAALLVGLSGTWPLSQRVRDLGMALEVGLPLVAALLAAPLLMAERERETLCWLAARARCRPCWWYAWRCWPSTCSRAAGWPSSPPACSGAPRRRGRPCSGGGRARPHS